MEFADYLDQDGVGNHNLMDTIVCVDSGNDWEIEYGWIISEYLTWYLHIRMTFPEHIVNNQEQLCYGAFSERWTCYIYFTLCTYIIKRPSVS